MRTTEIKHIGNNWYLDVRSNGKPDEFIPCKTKKAAEELKKLYQ